MVEAGVAAGPSISPPKKKLKTMESKVERSEAPAMRRNQHRLSVLPSLPLDILYEIFFRISPRDLLNLTYTNKAFRKLLLSRDSRFVWSTVLSSMEKQLYPPPPEDMSEPAWANLVWGKPNCTTCGAKAPKILWRLRRRACKNCAKQHLTTGGIGMPTFSYQSRTVPVSLFLPAISARTIESHWREVYHMWDEDVYAFQAEIKALRDQYPSTADFISASEVYLTQMLERRQSIDKHADLCTELKTKRASERADELEVLKQQRFEHIKARLLALGYEEQDINHFNIRHHKQVRVSKPLTDRVWSVIGPIIRSDVDEVRDERLESAKQRRYNERKGMVAVEYVALLRNIAPSILTFIPNLDNLLNLPLVAAVTEQDCEVSPELFENICDALYSSSEDIEWWIRVRLTRLEALIPSTWAKPPQDWVFEPFPQSCLKFVDVDDTLYSLDLAAYVFHCPPSPMCPTFDSCIHGEQYFVGLEALAHQCNLSDSSELRILPDQHGHEAVMQALELLKMDPHTTTVLQMDLLGRYFLCDCSLEEPEARGVMTWRGVIQHATTLHKSAPLRLRMLTPLEQLYSLLRNPEPICHRAAVWGCAYCTAHLNLAHTSGGVNLNHWFGWQGIKKHLREEHDVERIVEGRDVFSNRTGRFWNERIRDIPTDLDIAKLKHFVDELVVCGRVPEK